MSEHIVNPEILLKLQRHRGYEWNRIRPYPLQSALWIAETKIAGKWRGVRTLKSSYRAFATPEHAYIALEDLRETPFTD